MDREKTERITNTDEGQVPGRNQQINRQLSARLGPKSVNDNNDGQEPGSEERGIGKTRSDLASGSDPHNDHRLSSNERGDRQLGSRSSSVTVSVSCVGHFVRPGKLHSNRQLCSMSITVSDSDSCHTQSLGPEELHRKSRLRSRSSTMSGFDSDNLLDREGNKLIRSRSSSLSGSDNNEGSLLDREDRDKTQIRSRPSSVSASDNNESSSLNHEERDKRQICSRSSSVSGCDSNEGNLLYLEDRDKKQKRSSTRSLSVSISDHDKFSDGEEEGRRYTYSSSSFTSFSDSDASQFSDCDEQDKDHRNLPKNSSTGFRFHSRSAALYQDDDEDDIREDIEAYVRRRDDNLSHRNQVEPVKTAVVRESILYERKQSRKQTLPRGDFKHADVIDVSFFPIDSKKKVTTALYTNQTRQKIHTPSTNTAILRQSEQCGSRNNEMSAPYPKNEKENTNLSRNTNVIAKAGDETESVNVICLRESNSNFEEGRDVKNQKVESLPNIHKRLPNIHKSPNYVNRKKTTERIDQIEGFVTLKQSIILQRREEEVHPTVAVPDPVRQEVIAATHATKTQKKTEKPNCHDFELFEHFYLLSQNSRIIKKSRQSDETLRWLRLNGAGQMCRIGCGTLVAVIQTTVGIVCLQTDPTLEIRYRIETNRQYLSLCHLFTFKYTNESRPSNRHSFAVTCTERREDNGKFNEFILHVKPSDSQLKPKYYREYALKLNTPSLSGICSIHFIKRTHLVVGCRDSVALLLFSTLSVLWVCNLDRCPTDLAFWDPVILVCVPDEFKVKAIDMESGKIVNDNILARTDDQGWMPHRISVCGNSFLVKLYSRDSRQEVKIVEYTRDDNQQELTRRERPVSQ